MSKEMPQVTSFSDTGTGSGLSNATTPSEADSSHVAPGNGPADGGHRAGADPGAVARRGPAPPRLKAARARERTGLGSKQSAAAPAQSASGGFQGVHGALTILRRSPSLTCSG